MSYETSIKSTHRGQVSIYEATIIFKDGRQFGAVSDVESIAVAIARKAAGL